MDVCGWRNECASRAERAPPQSYSCCVMILLAIIDGAGPDVPVEDQDAETKNRTNGNEPERQIVQENEQQNPTKTAETAKEPVQTSTSPKCAFSRTVIPIDLKRFTNSGVTSVECPDCGRTRSRSPVKGVLRFPPHEPRKIQTEVQGKRWSATGKTDWAVAGRREKPMKQKITSLRFRLTK